MEDREVEQAAEDALQHAKDGLESDPHRTYNDTVAGLERVRKTLAPVVEDGDEDEHQTQVYGVDRDTAMDRLAELVEYYEAPQLEVNHLTLEQASLALARLRLGKEPLPEEFETDTVEAIVQGDFDA